MALQRKFSGGGTSCLKRLHSESLAPAAQPAPLSVIAKQDNRETIVVCNKSKKSPNLARRVLFSKDDVVYLCRLLFGSMWCSSSGRRQFKRVGDTDITSGRREMDLSGILGEERAERARWHWWKKAWKTVR
jgi:hypothetical protein